MTGAGRKKKARMAGTRSDFLTRACSTEVDSNEDEDDEYEYRPALSRTLTLPESLGSLDPIFDSDSEMVKLIPDTKTGPSLGYDTSLTNSSFRLLIHQKTNNPELHRRNACLV